MHVLKFRSHLVKSGFNLMIQMTTMRTNISFRFLYMILICDDLINFFLTCRQLMNGTDEHINMYGGLLPPLSRTTTETFLPVYGTMVADSFPTKPLPFHTDSDLMHTPLVSRKRSRGDSVYQYQQFQDNLNNFSFVGEDISLLIQYQQFEIENFISQHVSDQSN